MKAKAHTAQTAPHGFQLNARLERFTFWRGTILEIGLPCACGKNDAARVRSDDGTQGFICKAWWDAHQ